MKKQISIAFLVFLFCGQNSFAQGNDCLNKFSWLTGTWKMQDKETVTVEEWSSAGPAALKCKSYEVKGRDTTMIENASMSCIGGKQVFTFHPILTSLGDNRQPVSFVLISVENNTFVFENKSNDFPQRVVYQNVNANECHARIEGVQNGKMERVDFNYKRVK